MGSGRHLVERRVSNRGKWADPDEVATRVAHDCRLSWRAGLANGEDSRPRLSWRAVNRVAGGRPRRQGRQSASRACNLDGWCVTTADRPQC